MTPSRRLSETREAARQLTASQLHTAGGLQYVVSTDARSRSVWCRLKGMSLESQVPGPDDLRLVQLAHVDVDPSALTGDGADLSGVIAGYQPMDKGATVEAGSLPRTGWRAIASTPARPGLGRTSVFAAPHQDDRTGWALINVTEKAGRWIFSTDPGPVFARPGRPSRRQALRLCWPEDPIIAAAGSVPELAITLHNVSEKPWIAAGEDDRHTLGWLIGSHGDRLPAPDWFSYGGPEALPSLEPGEVTVLPVSLVTNDVADLPAGQYGLDALLLELNLRSNRGALRLI